MAITVDPSPKGTPGKGQIWKCRVCKCKAELRPEHRTAQEITVRNPTPRVLKLVWTVCPNLDCQEISLVLKIIPVEGDLANGQHVTTKPIHHWVLLPHAQGVALPSYIPDHLVNDYKEACAIKVLSPKASATLARRCLQGIIRKKWEVKPGRLVDELSQIKEQIEPDLWDAIDAVRKVGNVAAHLAEDVNQIVEVHPKEAQLLIELIEILFKDWFIATAERQERLQKVALLAERKTVSKGQRRCAPVPVS